MSTTSNIDPVVVICCHGKYVYTVFKLNIASCLKHKTHPSLIIVIIKSPKQSLGDLLFLLRFLLLLLLLLLLSLPNKVWETYCFCSVSYYYFYFHYYSSSPFFPRTMNLSTADLRNYWTEFHETWWSYRYMFLVGPTVFSFVVKAVKVIF